MRETVVAHKRSAGAVILLGMPVVFLRDEPRLRAYDVGEHSYADGGLDVVDFGEGAALRIGRYCSIAKGVTILLGGEHRVDWVTTYPFSALFADAESYPGHPATKGDVAIGSDVWIGMHAVVLSGVRVEDGAVVGAGSVVTRDVPAFGIVAGNPARLVRYRFPREERRALQQIAWWNWPDDEVRKAWPRLLSTDVAGFIDTYR